jgi:hypothetical protein
MSEVEPPTSSLIGLTADVALLDAGPESLPRELWRPAAAVPGRAPQRLASAGAALSAGAVLAGVALVGLSAIELIAGPVWLSGGALVLGVVLAGTHRWWARAEKAGARASTDRRQRERDAAQRSWIEAIEPYPRFEVSTAVTPHGSIEIVRACFSPVRSAGEHFRFERAIELSEVHDGEAPSATVVERAEELRREAALDTERARERYEELAELRGGGRSGGAGEREYQAAVRATADALSERINANLREPPLQG